MLAIDIPIALLSGLVLAESGKRMLKGNDPNQHYFMDVDGVRVPGRSQGKNLSFFETKLPLCG